LWSEPALKQFFNEFKRQFYTIPATEYLLNNLPRILHPQYVPSVHDILLSRVKTTGIAETEFNWSHYTIRVYDAGGARNERKKWQMYINTSQIALIIFTVNAAEFDLKLYEDSSTNRMKESLQLFSEIVNNPLYNSNSNTKIILMFTNTREFAKKFYLSQRLQNAAKHQQQKLQQQQQLQQAIGNGSSSGNNASSSSSSSEYSASPRDNSNSSSSSGASASSNSSSSSYYYDFTKLMKQVFPHYTQRTRVEDALRFLRLQFLAAAASTPAQANAVLMSESNGSSMSMNGSSSNSNGSASNSSAANGGSSSQMAITSIYPSFAGNSLLANGSNSLLPSNSSHIAESGNTTMKTAAQMLQKHQQLLQLQQSQHHHLKQLRLQNQQMQFANKRIMTIFADLVDCKAMKEMWNYLLPYLHIKVLDHSNDCLFFPLLTMQKLPNFSSVGKHFSDIVIQTKYVQKSWVLIL